ncbi:helix-turn-helix domain-containing protein [Aquimarina sp. M1]
MKIQVKFDTLEICNNALKDKLDSLKLKYRLNTFGEVEILESLSQEERENLFEVLNTGGVETVSNHQMILVDKIKKLIVDLIESETSKEKVNFSEYLEQKLPYSYAYLSRIFSDLTHITLEKFIILKKIDYVKELLIEKNLSLSEIAYKLNYSSVAHLSNQFKKTTGFSPSSFVDLKHQLNTRK